MPFDINGNKYDVNIVKSQQLNDIATNGLIYHLDAGNSLSYSTTKNIVKVKTYSTYNGLRSANYTVQWSDNNSTWTTAFSGVMSNNSEYSYQTGSGFLTTPIGAHRYWRYVEGSAVVSHHPRISKIVLVDSDDNHYVIKKYVDDNHSDSGEYIIGTVPYDFATHWQDVGGYNGYCNFIGGPTYSSSNGGCIEFSGSGTYGLTSSIRNYKTFSLWAYINDNTTNYLLDARTGSPNGWVWHGSTGTDWDQWFINGTSATVSMQSLPTNQWFHLYMRNSGTQIGTVTLMARYTFGENKVGKYGMFSVYNRELSIAEIRQNYESQKSRFGL